MALLDIVTKGSTNRSLTLVMADSTDGTRETGVVAATTGLDIWYRREGGLKVSLTESNLATLDAAHSDGGLLHISDGEYRVDFPDAAFATGANYVDVGWGATGMIGFGGRVRLTNLDLEDAVRGGMTALPNAAADAAGGLPISDAGALDLDAKIGALTFGTANRVNAQVYGMEAGTVTAAAIANAAIDAATFAADVDAEFLSYLVDDATRIDASALNTAATAVGSNGSGLTEAGGTGDQFTGLPKGLTPIATGTAQSATSSTIVLAASTAFGNDILNGTVINIISGTGAGQSRIIFNYTGATDTAETYPAWTTNPSSDSVYEIVNGSINLEMWMRDTVNTVANLGDGHNYPTMYIAGFSAASGQTAVTNMLNNYSGTITSFDALDTAQDTQHATTQGKIDTVDGIVDNILLDTAEIGAAGAGLTSIPWNAAWDAEVQSEVTAGLNAYDPPTRAELTTDTNSVLSKLLKYTQLIVRSDAAIGTDNATELTDINANGGSGAGDYSNQTEALEAILDTGATDWITATGFSTLDAAGVRTAVGLAAANLDTQLADIPTVSEFNARTLVAADYFDPAVDPVANVTLVGTTTTNTDMRGTNNAATATALTTVDTVVDAIKVITDALGATAAARLALSAGQIIPGTVDTVTNGHTPTTTVFQADDITEATADHYNGRIVIFTSGALAGQATDITDYVAVGGIGQLTVTAMTDAPANDDTFIII